MEKKKKRFEGLLEGKGTVVLKKLKKKKMVTLGVLSKPEG